MTAALLTPTDRYRARIRLEYATIPDAVHGEMVTSYHGCADCLAYAFALVCETLAAGVPWWRFGMRRRLRAYRHALVYGVAVLPPAERDRFDDLTGELVSMFPAGTFERLCQ